MKFWEIEVGSFFRFSNRNVGVFMVTPLLVMGKPISPLFNDPTHSVDFPTSRSSIFSNPEVPSILKGLKDSLSRLSASKEEVQRPAPFVPTTSCRELVVGETSMPVELFPLR